MLAPDWTGSLCFWFSAACVYYATMYYADARQRRRNAPPLDDVGFELSPRLPQLQVVCDSCGVGGALWMFSVLFVGDAAHTEYVRALFDYNALGNLLSATLHVVTVLPTAEFVDSQFPMMGGSSDKLMSNHTYNFGLLLRATTLCYGFPKWVLPLGVKNRVRSRRRRARPATPPSAGRLLLRLPPLHEMPLLRRHRPRLVGPLLRPLPRPDAHGRLALLGPCILKFVSDVCRAAQRARLAPVGPLRAPCLTCIGACFEGDRRRDRPD